MEHVDIDVVKEKLRIAYEQEIVRVYTRGARAAANQETPLSVCTVLKDKESGTVYHPYNALKVRIKAIYTMLRSLNTCTTST